MATPPTPGDFKNLIPSATGNLCDKIAKVLIQFPTLVYQFVAWMLKESATPVPTDDFKEFVCGIIAECEGSSGPINPSMPAPTGVSASDGSFSDKVTIVWGAVTPPEGIPAVTQYKVYRALATVSDPTLATLLATVDAPTLTYDDTAAVQGTTYNYWVVATNGTNTSNYGGPDPGNSGAPTTTLPAVSDLLASQGFSLTDDGTLALQWSPIEGATTYSIYRNTTNDFATATAIVTDQTPIDTLTTFNLGITLGEIYDNDENLVYREQPPSTVTKYYYWVTGSKPSPPATSPESNAAQGWVRIDATGEGTLVDKQLFVSPYVVPASGARMRMTVFGIGGGGAGGGEVWGGGGGGASAKVTLEFTVVPGDTITQVNTPGSGTTGNAAGSTSGANGPTVEIFLNAVSVAVITGGSGGVYNSSGNGAGGAIGGASGTGVLISRNGLAGKAAIGSAGGLQGASFGDIRRYGAWFNGDFNPGTGWDGNASSGTGGGGAHAEVGVSGGPDAIGGSSTAGGFILAVFA